MIQDNIDNYITRTANRLQSGAPLASIVATLAFEGLDEGEIHLIVTAAQILSSDREAAFDNHA